MAGPKVKKRKLNDDHPSRSAKEGVDTSKPTAVFTPKHGRDYTLSIALPGSIIANCHTHDQKTALAGQIARACAVFCVDEVIVFDDGQAETRPPEQGGYTAYADPNFFLYHILSYLETPPHLRKALFPMHPDLRTAGALPSLDMPHHLRSDEWCPYREAVTIRPRDSGGDRAQTSVDCGLQQDVSVPVALEVGIRLTIRLPDDACDNTHNALQCEAVSPDEPREKGGYYWGYSVRQASSLSTVFTECPYDGGYDISIGTSERGIPVDAITTPQGPSYVAPTWKHLLVCFGGVAGLEAAFRADTELQQAGVAEVRDVFDRWINLVPGQGSRTIRTEEAVWAGCMAIRPLITERSASNGA